MKDSSPSRPGLANEPPSVDGSGFSVAVATRLALLLIVVLTVLAFAGVLGNEFVNWDDDYVLVYNEEYRGLGLEQLQWMFTTGFAGHYQPLTWLSFAIDSLVWGVEPVGFHVTNLLFHLVTAVGFFFVARRLLAAALPRPCETSRLVAALVAALLFAVHPLRVESVAWATERRDVLSGAWLMLTLVCYLRATDPHRGSGRRLMLTLSVLCYVASVLSKASAVTLPVVLLLLDFYPLRRLRRSGDPASLATVRQLLWEKVPFLVLAVAVGGMALWAQAQPGALRTLTEHPVELRIGQAFYGLAFYLGKSIWPAGLIPLYEQDPQATALDAPNILSAGIVVVLTLWFWILRRRAPALPVAWGAYVVFLLPVLGFAQSGPQLVADRYSYLSCMPWAVVLGGAVALLWDRPSSHPRAVRALVSVGILVFVGVLTVLTRNQTRVWADSYTLWKTVIERAPDTGTAHANLAALFNRDGAFEDARKHSLTALRILPGNRTAHIALARSAAELGDLATAEQHYRIAIDIRPSDTGRMIDLAYVKSRLGKPDEAEALFRHVVDLEPGSPTGYVNLASFLASRGREREARPYFEKALELDPADRTAWFRLGVIHLTLAEPARALQAFEQGLQYAPDDVLLNAKLAWVLATCRIDALRDGSRALELAARAVELDDARWAAREALAAAHAEMGDFGSAQAILTELLADQDIVLPERTTVRLESQLGRYRQGQPIRE